MAEPKIGPNRGSAGKGRPKGSPNKTTAAVKDMVLAALDKVGGVKYLMDQADKNPTAFLTLIGKIIPTQTDLTSGGQAIGIIRYPGLDD